ncbi:MAG: DUF1924 domain-containing protein [Burkholderiales bacterium]
MRKNSRCTAWRGLTLAAGLALHAAASASPVDDLLQQFRSQGAGNFTVAAGEKVWRRVAVDAKTGQARHCALCHTEDLSKMGKHATTGKLIEPLAPSANPERLTDREKIEKWLVRNCKWTFGRECTPQEKGDVLTMIRSR